MSFSRAALFPLAFLLLSPASVHPQEQPLPAGSEGVPVPKKLKHVQPEYPEEALAKGIRGIVILELVIDTEGNVAEARVIRSIEGLDEAALEAARQWRYEPVEVDGRPVSVRLTVPITFALKLPEVSRDHGISELRQGVTPAWPEDARGSGRAVADVTLDPDGRIGLARIIEGEEPWSSSLLQALRTWRFRTPPEDVTLSFRVEAEFAARSGVGGRVALHLGGLRETALLGAPEEGPSTAESTGVAAAEGKEPPATALEEAGAGAAPPGEPVAPREEPRTARETPPGPPGPPPSGSAEPGPAEAASVPTEADLSSEVPAPPPVEVIRGVAPPAPPENGVSAISGVQLEPGVPDLTRGRRPVSPPLARMAGVEGVVTVDFSVSAGGVTAVQKVDGPDLLRPEAEQAVESWTFRRTRADRAYLTAVFTYEDDLASALVRPQR